MTAPRALLAFRKNLPLQILTRILCSGGMSVRALAEALNMSYMGIKQPCLDLEKRGYLEPWRQPRSAPRGGRPEILYRATDKARALFPSEENALFQDLIHSAEALYGPAAPEKLLFRTYQRRAQQYRARLRLIHAANLEDRARWWVKIREIEGHLARLEVGSGAIGNGVNEKEQIPGGTPRETSAGMSGATSIATSSGTTTSSNTSRLRIVEYHSPIAGLLKTWPALLNRLEQDLVAQVLETQVRREEAETPPWHCTFYLG